ncbi:hypothetical protein THRCLA_10123 [Thraustotheca clavata]|uniref:Uncharacterized protein n=1 Tax=Thraustotheca clavata TaxID=74557 RepID=A0A1V9YT19_9STRA|nr:hypothetical protein THRCLA_10123 [Thraustotheca clavata]
MDESVELQHQVSVLEAELIQLRRRKRKIPWREVAVIQGTELQLALNENKRLKEALHEQTTMASDLQKAMIKAQEFQVEEWKCQRLPFDCIRWMDGIEKMLAEDYDHTNSLLIRHGLCDILEEIEKTQVKRLADGSVASIDKKVHILFPNESIENVTEICTELLTTDKGLGQLIKGTQWQALDALDSSLVEKNGLIYLTGSAKVPGGVSHGLQGNIAVQRFLEPNRVVFIFRSVLEDKRYPIKHDNVPMYIHNEVGWVVIEPDREKHGISIKSIVSCTPNLHTPNLSPVCPLAAYSASPPVLHPITKTMMRGCVNMYRQPNRCLTELIVRGLLDRIGIYEQGNEPSGVSQVKLPRAPTIHLVI